MVGPFRVLFLPSVVDAKFTAPVVLFAVKISSWPKEWDVELVGQDFYDQSFGHANFHRVRSRSRGQIPVLLLLRRMKVVLLTALISVGLGQRQKFDVVYLRHGSNSPVGVFLRWLWQIPVVAEVHGLAASEVEIKGWLRGASTGGRRVLSWAFRSFEKWAFSKAHTIISPTGALRDFLVHTYGLSSEKIVVVPNGVDSRLFQPEARSPVTEPYKGEFDYICFEGNLSPYQGLDTLFDAFAVVKRRFPRGRLLLVGDGVEAGRLKERAEELGLVKDICFVGSVLQDQIPALVNLSKVCVTSYQGERHELTGASPLKLFEYMACAKPVVSTDIKGVRELLEESHAGVLVPEGDSSAMAEGITRLLADERLQAELGHNGREYVLRHHDWSDISRRLADIVSSAGGRTHAARVDSGTPPSTPGSHGERTR